MKFDLSRRRFMRACTVSALSVLTGCGTILHPERRNQPPGGSLDWGVVALDTVGLLLFFIPGIIAFAVDFSTGAIYLPPPGAYGSSKPRTSDEPLVAVEVPRSELTTARIEAAVSEHAGQDVRLVAGKYETAPMKKVADFWPMWNRLATRSS